MGGDDGPRRSSMVDIDTSRTNGAIQEFELRFDSAKAGRHVGATKLAPLSTMTDCPLLKELIRGWVKNGIPIGQGGEVACMATRKVVWWSRCAKGVFPSGGSQGSSS